MLNLLCKLPMWQSALNRAASTAYEVTSAVACVASYAVELMLVKVYGFYSLLKDVLREEECP